MTFNLKVNGKPHVADFDDPNTPLLYFLQDDLKLNGPKFGCGLGQCGCCTVLLDGVPTRSCITAIADADGHDIVTIEGLGTPNNLHPVQAAFIEYQAMHCGFCISGPMLTGAAYLRDNPNATGEQIRNALSQVICRCHAHNRMIDALVRAGEMMA